MGSRGIYIFGAHSRAQTLAVYLQSLYPEIFVEAFLYDNEEPNPDMVNEVPVRFLDGMELCAEYPVYIGTRGIFHEKIAEHLRKLGCQTILPVTVELDLTLRNRYLKKHFADIGRDFIKIDSLPESMERSAATVYVVRSICDPPLKNSYEKKPYEKFIQAGAALISERIPDCPVTDDSGDNISEKNRQFCELTALYWIWKNAEEDVVGLAHYRRHFLLPDQWLERMLSNQVDVILPVPLYVAPNIAQNYRDRHVASDWDFMMDYMKKIHPEDYAQARDFFDTNLYSPCNMFIMRKRVLDDLCTWLFPILFICAEHGGEREDGYQNRYPGFLSERLMTFFFEKRRDQYRVVYADKNFLE